MLLVLFWDQSINNNTNTNNLFCRSEGGWADGGGWWWLLVWRRCKTEGKCPKSLLAEWPSSLETMKALGKPWWCNTWCTLANVFVNSTIITIEILVNVVIHSIYKPQHLYYQASSFLDNYYSSMNFTYERYQGFQTNMTVQLTSPMRDTKVSRQIWRFN